MNLRIAPRRMALIPLAVLALVSGQIAQADGVYTLAEAKDAEQRAQDQGLGVAWVSSVKDLTLRKNPKKGDSDDLTQMVMDTLRRGDDSCVVIFLDGEPELDQSPNAVYNAMVEPDDIDFKTHQPCSYVPKIVFTNPDASFVLGKVTYSQMHRDREKPLIDMLFHVAREIHKGQYDPAPAISPPPSPAPESTTDAAPSDAVSLSMPDGAPPHQVTPRNSDRDGEGSIPELPKSGSNLPMAALIIVTVSLGSGLLIYQLFVWSTQKGDRHN